ncbi:MAG: phosphoethanolamine transferase [Bacteroidales bacterium]|nr:phosphoethanolamine transferase [Candidatus Physcousia equi]
MIREKLKKCIEQTRRALLIESTLPFFISMCLLGALCTLAVRWDHGRAMSLVELGLDVYLLCFLLSLLPVALRRVGVVLLSTFFYLLSALDLFLYHACGQPITPNLLLLFLQTHKSEASEALHTYLTSTNVCSLWLAIIPIIALHIYLSRHKPPRLRTTRMQSMVSGAIALYLLGATAITWRDKQYKFYRLVMQKSELETQRCADLTPRSRFYLPVYRLWDAIVQVRHQAAIYASLCHSQQVAHQQMHCTFESPEIVLILGESFSRHHAQLYGYPFPNTPHQKAWEEQGQLVCYTDVVAPWNTTCESLQSLFSLSYAGDTLSWHERPFITSLMKSAGYDVCFLSNQYSLDKTQSLSDFIEDVFINIPEVSRLQFSRRNKQLGDLDDHLLQAYDTMEPTIQSPHRFTIFHTRGMHFDFSERYPKERRRFSPADYHRPDLSADQLTTLAHYDNAILYNDSIIHEILLRFQHRNAIAIFLPDHGERVFDYDNHFGRSLGFTPEELLPQHEIPMWFWASEQYIAEHPDLWTSIRSHYRLPYMTDLLPYTIMSLAGTTDPYYDSTLDILSPNYRKDRKRILRDQCDYDLLCR